VTSPIIYEQHGAACGTTSFSTARIEGN